jgi:hypothetical protein
MPHYVTLPRYDRQRLKEVFAEARALPASDRQLYLFAACAGNQALRQEVESLLASDERAKSFLESPASSAGWWSFDSLLDSPSTRRPKRSASRRRRLSVSGRSPRPGSIGDYRRSSDQVGSKESSTGEAPLSRHPMNSGSSSSAWRPFRVPSSRTPRSAVRVALTAATIASPSRAGVMMAS